MKEKSKSPKICCYKSKEDMKLPVAKGAGQEDAPSPNAEPQ